MKKSLYNKFLNKLSRNIHLVEQIENNSVLIRFIGIAFLLLGIGYLLEVVELTSIALVSFSLSGMFYILSDFFKYYCEDWDAKRALGKDRLKWVRLYRFLWYVSLFIGTIMLIGGPYLIINIDVQLLEIAGPAIAFITIGLTVIKISLDNRKDRLDTMEGVVDDVTKILNELEEYKEKNKRLEADLNRIHNK
ncbi:hypothetical protein [Jeotgalibacillus sp. JSM ZJ347]|uniref:hypothetical protein n=1 Tax=Jeotgalibacillus sp. JSM ZJ347 TaxID=3342117 RepID=UPI0035A846A0